jgi:hypothetical protein
MSVIKVQVEFKRSEYIVVLDAAVQRTHDEIYSDFIKIYLDEGRKVEIRDDVMPVGNRFYAKIEVYEQKNSLEGENFHFTEVIPSFPVFKKQEIDKLNIASWPARSDFRQFGFSDIAYIDKTSFFQRLFDKGRVFLSRPRRFGKTILVSTLKELFLGNREIFAGLDAEVNWDSDHGIQAYYIIF